MTVSDAIATGNLLDIARAYVAVGLSVIPVWADGSKAPRLAAWTRFGDKPPTDAEMVEWFRRGAGGGLGIPGGPASGNLAVLDFETAAIWETWLSLLTKEQRSEADKCPLARTPRGGAHLYVRLPLPTRGVTLAEQHDGEDARGRKKTKTLIETRAHGGQVLAPGCPPECHPLKTPYTWERTAWVDAGESNAVSVETWATWLDLAAGLTQVERKTPDPLPDTRNRDHLADDPGTDFNHRGTWEQTGLFAAGWEVARSFGNDTGTVRRPGKDGPGISGTVGVVSSSKGGHPLFHCFTSNGDPFESGGNYDRFGTFARLEHASDFKAASKALRQLGYGKQDSPAPSVTWGKTNQDGATGRGFKWASELAAPDRADDWIWEGYLPRGATTLLSALWKAGKTTLLAHLLKACGTGGDFLGKPLKASKVLYISEEGERHWVRRRDNLGLADSVGFYLQPFASRPAQAGWQAFVNQIVEDVKNHGFDLVVFDTLAKLWPVQEENDAGAVDAALLPLWGVTKAGAGVLLIHHMRKSGGQEYTGSRGSGALSAFPDILIELTRFDGTDAKSKKRVLRAKGRYEETPDEVVIELVDGQYAIVPDLAAPADPTIVFGPSSDTKAWFSELSEEDRVLHVLRSGEWMQSDTIRTELSKLGGGIRDEDVSTHLSSLKKSGQVVMRGKLRSKTEPREFRCASHSAPGCHGNEMREGDGELASVGHDHGGNETAEGDGEHLIPIISFPRNTGSE